MCEHCTATSLLHSNDGSACKMSTALLSNETYFLICDGDGGVGDGAEGVSGGGEKVIAAIVCHVLWLGRILDCI